MSRLHLRGPKEQDLQAWILRSLGTEQYEQKTTKTGKTRWVSTGVYVGPGRMFWRQNSGAMPTPSGGYVRMSAPGVPDILGTVGGIAVGLEVKRPGEKQNANQVWFQAWWEAAGGRYYIVECPADAKVALAAISDADDCYVPTCQPTHGAGPEPARESCQQGIVAQRVVRKRRRSKGATS